MTSAQGPSPGSFSEPRPPEHPRQAGRTAGPRPVSTAGDEQRALSSLSDLLVMVLERSPNILPSDWKESGEQDPKCRPDLVLLINQHLPTWLFLSCHLHNNLTLHWKQDKQETSLCPRGMRWGQTEPLYWQPVPHCRPADTVRGFKLLFKFRHELQSSHSPSQPRKPCILTLSICSGGSEIIAT